MGGSVHASAERLFEEFPQWRPFSRTGSNADGSELMVVEVGAPAAADVEHGLFIEIALDEVTVYFDVDHEHFNDWDSRGTLFEIESALDTFIRPLLDERAVTMSWWAGDTCVASSRRQAGHLPDSDSELTDLLELHGTRVRVRSWRGTFNIDGGS